MSSTELALRHALDEVRGKSFYGSRLLLAALHCKRVQRLMRLMSIQAVGPKPRLSQAHPGHRVYRYVLRDVEIDRVDQVWSCGVTYIRLRSGFVYLKVILDWFSRYLLAWELSGALDGQFCPDAARTGAPIGRSEIFNTDQDAQCTSDAFTSLLREDLDNSHAP